MNRWHVYEFVKKYYMKYGILPSWNKVINQFPNLSYEEIREGVTEFKEVIKWGA